MRWFFIYDETILFEFRENFNFFFLKQKTLEVEAAAVVEDRRPPPNWPRRGALRFANVKMRYRTDLPLVLKGISFDIEPSEKIGQLSHCFRYSCVSTSNPTMKFFISFNLGSAYQHTGTLLDSVTDSIFIMSPPIKKRSVWILLGFTGFLFTGLCLA